MSKKGNRRAAIVFFGTVLTCAVLILIANKTVSIAKKQRTRFWIQYGTLKYDLIGHQAKSIGQVPELLDRQELKKILICQL